MVGLTSCRKVLLPLETANQKYAANKHSGPQANGYKKKNILILTEKVKRSFTFQKISSRSHAVSTHIAFKN